jgi:hypothetical protein
MRYPPTTHGGCSIAASIIGDKTDERQHLAGVAHLGKPIRPICVAAYQLWQNGVKALAGKFFART